MALFLPAPLAARDIFFPPYPPALCQGQPPFREAEIPVLAEMYAQNVTASNGTGDADRERITMDVARRHGMAPERALCGFAKFWATMMLTAVDPPSASQVARECGTRLCLPNPRELKLMGRALNNLAMALGWG
jgi:hypothetical protein